MHLTTLGHYRKPLWPNGAFGFEIVGIEPIVVGFGTDLYRYRCFAQTRGELSQQGQLTLWVEGGEQLVGRCAGIQFLHGSEGIVKPGFGVVR